MSRYIDADALISWIKESQQMTSKMRNIICKIESMPDAVEVVHGEWIDKMNYRDGSYYSICSECGYFDDERDDLTAYNFCPNCGAKMKGADDE